MITNIYYLHAPIDSNIFTTIHNLLKHTQQDKILSLTFFGTCIDQTYHTILHNIKQAVYTILSKKNSYYIYSRTNHFFSRTLGRSLGI